jgi:hypothetical protein
LVSQLEAGSWAGALPVVGVLKSHEPSALGGAGAHLGGSNNQGEGNALKDGSKSVASAFLVFK